MSQKRGPLPQADTLDRKLLHARKPASEMRNRPIYAGFVLTGIVTTLLGPMIPILSARWGIGDDRTAYMFTAQFLGALSGTLATGGLFTRFGYIKPIAAAFLLMSAGTAALALAPWPAGLAAVFTYGVGLGVVVPGINLYIAATVTQARAAALNTLNFLWGLGAVSGPPAMALLCTTYGILLPHALLASLLVITSAVVLGTCRRSETRSDTAGPGLAKGIQASGWAPAVLIAVFVFLYVGMENSIGGWAATYAGRITTWPEGTWPLASLVFWGAVMTGRGIAPRILSRISEARLIMVALGVAIAGNVLIVSAFSSASLLSGILIAGLGFATIYPMTVASMSRFYGPSAASIGPFVFGMAALGGATLPWAVGHFSASLGSLRLGLLVPLVASVGMIGLQLSIAAASGSLERAGLSGAERAPGGSIS